MLKVSWSPPGLSIGTTGIHYGWLIAVMAAVLQVTTNFVNQAFAVLLPVIEETFGWSLTAITLAYFFKSIVQAMLSPVAGSVADRYGARRSLRPP